ncbi:GNAT family N-acetyltransferase [Pandoraea pnomenusa]|uniref:GNAT family N-acetyltransferase n=1 Tax=Pandoraea pnomenusa TaxID=93220 RepID=UPI00334148DE
MSGASIITYVPVKAEAANIEQYRALFADCFPGVEKFKHPEFLTWLYVDNPDGHVVGFDAFDGERLIAHYACIPASLRLRGNVVRALLSLNTATHPDFQGKGLFSRLADMTYRHGADLGFDCVYGVANANSTPGFVRKLGFQLVQPLEARVGFGSLGIDFSAVARDAEFERIWRPESIGWRQANPTNPIRSWSTRGRRCFESDAAGRLVSAYAELPASDTPQIYTGARALQSPGRVYLGLVPEGACAFRTYLPIPSRLRPAPLNLIYRSLAKDGDQVSRGAIQFTYMDFDAY